MMWRGSWHRQHVHLPSNEVFILPGAFFVEMLDQSFWNFKTCANRSNARLVLAGHIMCPWHLAPHSQLHSTPHLEMACSNGMFVSLPLNSVGRPCEVVHCSLPGYGSSFVMHAGLHPGGGSRTSERYILPFAVQVPAPDVGSCSYLDHFGLGISRPGCCLSVGNLHCTRKEAASAAIASAHRISTAELQKMALSHVCQMSSCSGICRAPDRLIHHQV
jgi:hypothetical protein